jgi:phospholipase/carboxylesterase
MRQGTSIKASLEHLMFLPTSGGKNLPTLIALHGRGTNENDLVPVILALEISDLLLISPRAPFRFPYGGYAWYELGQEAIPEPETLQTSMELLRKFVEEVKAGYPVDPERLILLGFSQGTMMAYATALANPERFRGIVALSGYMPIRSNLSLQLNNLAGFPVFISHGSSDQIISVRYGREAAKLLTDGGAEVTYHEYPMGHEIREETIRDIKKWVRETLDYG